MEKHKLERQIRQLPKSNRIGTSQESYTIQTEETPVSETPVMNTPVEQEVEIPVNAAAPASKVEEKFSSVDRPASETPPERPMSALSSVDNLSKEDLMNMLSVMMNGKGLQKPPKKKKVRKNQITIYLTDEELRFIDSKLNKEFRSRSDVITYMLSKWK